MQQNLAMAHMKEDHAWEVWSTTEPLDTSIQYDGERIKESDKAYTTLGGKD